RGRGTLERHFALRDGPIFDAVDGLTRFAVEQEQQAYLVDDGDSGNRLAPLLDVDQRRGRSQVGVPDVVPDDLEVPEVLARVGIGRHEAAAEQVVALAVAAILIDRRRAERQVDDAALVIDGHQAPDVDAGPVAPAVAGPRVVKGFTFAGHRLE